MQRETAIVLEVWDLSEQEIQVTAQGNEILLFEKNAAQAQVDDRNAAMPDVLEVFARAANLGMLCGSAHAPWLSRAEILARQIDLDQKTQIWEAAWHHLDKGAFHVLLSLLRARDLDRIAIRARNTPTDSRRTSEFIQLAGLQYPGYYGPTPFRLDIEAPESPAKNRQVQITFSREPTDELVEAVYAALETWTNLLLLGGYPEDEVSPRNAGVYPDLAYLFDAWTITQDFEIFASAEAAFNAVINHAQVLHSAGHQIEAVRIR